MKRALTIIAVAALLVSAQDVDAQTSKKKTRKVVKTTKATTTTKSSTSTAAPAGAANGTTTPTSASTSTTATSKSTLATGLSSILSLSNSDYSNGLKDALKIAASKSAESASMLDGFNKNLDIRIPFPKEAIAVKEYAVKLGLQYQVDIFEEKLNRAAEEAAKKAAPIFLAAIVNMSFADAAKIVTGDKNAATLYLRNTAGAELANQFKPVVADALSQVAITKYWKPLVDKYNKVAPFLAKEQVNADLEQYVTNKAVDGLFILVEKEEGKIRQEPAKYGSDLVKKIFGTTK